MNTQKSNLKKRLRAATRLRMPEELLRDIEIIADDEQRDLSTTMRCLLQTGVDDYHITGTLYQVGSPHPAKTRGEKERRAYFREFLRKIVKAVEREENT
jgi:hypothetical protein